MQHDPLSLEPDLEGSYVFGLEIGWLITISSHCIIIYKIFGLFIYSFIQGIQALFQTSYA